MVITALYPPVNNRYAHPEADITTPNCAIVKDTLILAKALGPSKS
jgi:hypothetical protein